MGLWGEIGLALVGVWLVDGPKTFVGGFDALAEKQCYIVRGVMGS